MSPFRKFCGLLLPVAVVFLLNSCASYYMSSRPLDIALEKGGEVVLLEWNGQILELRNAQVTDEILTGVIVGLNLIVEKERQEIGVETDESSSIFFLDDEFPVFEELSKKSRTHEVHILISASYPMPENFDPII